MQTDNFGTALFLSTLIFLVVALISIYYMRSIAVNLKQIRQKYAGLSFEEQENLKRAEERRERVRKIRERIDSEK